MLKITDKIQQSPIRVILHSVSIVAKMLYEVFKLKYVLAKLKYI